jgi:3'-phosphoadenosine 5'-phosphosulfate sulfotransferase (PAPS reductase)/FAD synthetase
MKSLQKNIFGNEHILTMPPVAHNLDEQLRISMDIVQRAIIDYQPYAVCLMLSGGDDSITALKVALMLGVRIDYIIHGNTGTGLKDVLKYVRKVAEMTGIRLLIADAGNTWEQRVKTKGFFGTGKMAHSFAYHLLKNNPFQTTISRYIRKGIPGRKILLLNGVRVEESDNRADNFGDNVYRIRKGNIWVNIIHWWTKKECLALLDAEHFARSPVAIALGRSGECNCGTMQNEASRLACKEYDPEWGDWMWRVRKYVVAKFGWDIHQTPSKEQLAEIKAAVAKIDNEQIMCTGCKAAQLKLFNND